MAQLRLTAVGRGRVERLLCAAQVVEQALAVGGRADAGGQGHPVGGGGADGGRAAHVHLTDAARHVGDRIECGDHLLAGQ